MFHWYQKATICYVYLVDVPSCLDSSEIYDSIARSRWFTRGWTLQELLAPADIIFYSRDWKSLGTKSELLGVVSSITGIEEDFLQGKELEYASISKRMSWAAKRKTSRVEDIAYCLFGIFAVNMPLIYGEGKKSFQRLQHELIKTYPYDHTLYAWGVVVDRPSLLIPRGELPGWNQSDARRRLLGALAISPRDFEFSGSFLPSPRTKDFYNDPRAGRARLPIPLGLGVQFELPISCYSSAYHWSQVKTTQRRELSVAILFCLFKKNSDLHIGIPLQSCGDASWGRTSEITSQRLLHNLSSFVGRIETIHVEPEQPILLENGDIIFRRLTFSNKLLMTLTPYSSGAAGFIHGVNVISQTSYGQFACLYFQQEETGDNQLRGLGIIFGRLSDETRLAGKLSVWVAPTRDSAAKDDMSVCHDGATMVTEDFLMENWHRTEMELEVGASGSKYYHIMEPSADSWVLDVEPLPKISIKVERLPLDLGRDEGVVDVVDLVIDKRI
jgi:hypothetical protein